jgi:lipid-A-disaccharide synthase
MKILISAAETSSDQHGALLLRSLKRLAGNAPLDAFGVGGPKLQAEGLRAVVDARELLAMGFLEILSRLPRIWRAMRELEQAAALERPDVAVVMDYPDFHFRLARRLRRLNLGFPVVYYIPPKVWAWRKGRVRLLRERFDRILTILPFEAAFYRSVNLDASYVGNPLLDELPLHLSRSEAREKLGIAASAKVLVLMPGSRPAELSHHLNLMLDAALGAALELRESLTVLLPLPVTADFRVMSERVATWRQAHASASIDLKISQGDAPLALVAADAGLIKSGTSTLEAALLGCAHAVVYQTSWLSHFIFHRIVRLTFKGPVGLVNLVHGWKEGEPWLVREFIDYGTRAPELQAEVVSLFCDEKKRARIQAGLTRIRTEMRVASDLSPSDQAARAILSLVTERGGQKS